ncbi:MAG: bifunctional adenosylcobinamide kinase/adenosylcobinamide-phosphate guanylyltransferase [Blastococcus sp.]|nr:bifunctional adenosylcobinamide kinase/adenosylcobinamide-phosphate guanylyltransferase [Blastococcus sp.]
MSRTLVLGGSRSGKSAHAESLLEGRDDVTYLATTDPRPGDADWAARIDAHRDRRPASWGTVETQDLAGVLAEARDPLLVDCLGTWLTAIIDAEDAWEHDSDAVHDLVLARTDEVVAALVRCEQDVVLVTNEVGLGIVPEHRSGRLFRDLLGVVNQRVAAACDEVHLVVAGRVLRL